MKQQKYQTRIATIMERQQRNRQRLNRARRGAQGLVETAIVMMLLVSITMGLIQYGLLYNAVDTLTQLAREGARFAAIHGTDDTTVVNGVSYLPDPAIRYYVQLKARASSISPADLPDSAITISPVDNNVNRVSGKPITVALTYSLRKKLFLPSRFWGINLIPSSYTATVSHTIE